MFLSTAQPSVGGSAPKLGIQNIQFKQPAYLAKKKGVMLSAAFLSRRSTASYYDEELEDSDEDDSLSDYENCSVVKAFRAGAGGAPPPAPLPPPPPPPPQMKVDVAKVML